MTGEERDRLEHEQALQRFDGVYPPGNHPYKHNKKPHGKILRQMSARREAPKYLDGAFFLTKDYWYISK